MGPCVDRTVTTMTSKTLTVIRDEHRALRAMLLSMHQLIRRGPADDSARFFRSLRAMLLYIDEYPERLHHPKETELLFPRVVSKRPEARAVIERLNADHKRSEHAVKGLMHLLVGWEFLGNTRRPAFEEAFSHYRTAYLDHMDAEEQEILPVAQKVLTDDDWALVDRAFEVNRDPLTGKYPAEGVYEALFTRITSDAPAPVGVGGQ